MGIEKLIQYVVAVATLVVATGQLPKLMRELQIAQLKLLRESQSS